MLNPNEYYAIACEYMAKTELYDRGLTSCRSPFDNTEAFIRQPYLRKMSTEYALFLKKELSKVCGGRWHPIQVEITKHNFYTAQMWIDEFYRLENRTSPSG